MTFSLLLVLSNLSILIPILRVPLLNRVGKVVHNFTLQPKISIGQSVSYARKIHTRNLEINVCTFEATESIKKSAEGRGDKAMLHM